MYALAGCALALRQRQAASRAPGSWLGGLFPVKLRSPVSVDRHFCADHFHFGCALPHKALDGGLPDARQLSAHDHRAAARCPAQQRVDVACCHCGPGISRVGVGTAQPCALLFGAAAKQHQFGVWGVRNAHTAPAGGQLVGEDPSMFFALWTARRPPMSACW